MEGTGEMKNTKLWVGDGGTKPTYTKNYPVSALRAVAMRPCKTPGHETAVEFHDYEHRIVPASIWTDPTGAVRLILCARCCDEEVLAMPAGARLGESIEGVVEGE
jgi:hypothetical protein